MSNKFKVGQRVRCIYSNPYVLVYKDGLYTVSKILDNGDINLEGIEEKNKYAHEHFELAEPQSNIPTGCKPFNYEEAIKDLGKVVTRDGRKVNELHRFHNDCIGGTIGHNPKFIYGWYIDGRYNEQGEPRSEDLFLKDETVVYVNVSDNGTGVGYMFKDMAIRQGGGSYISIAAITISNGEVIKTETVHKY